MSERNSPVGQQARRLRQAILERHGYESEHEVPDAGASNAIDDVARLATVTSHWGIASQIPVAGRIIVIAKRIIRISLRWYINPIVDQQNAFNDAVLRALHDLQAENDRLCALVSKSNPPSGDA